LFWKILSGHIANVLVIGGVAIEAVCTLLLFGFDEGISDIQQRKITQLEQPRHLSGEQKGRIAEVTKLHPSVTFVTVTTSENESWSFVMEIAAELKSDGWNWAACVDANGRGLKPLDPRPSSCQSILVGVQINAPDSLKGAADALGEAIREQSVIGMDDVRVIPDPSATTMEVMVGSKR
jgi:hypothetical protein